MRLGSPGRSPAPPLVRRLGVSTYC